MAKQRNGGSSLTVEDVRMIRRAGFRGESRLQIARDFGVSKQTVDRIIWRHTFDWVQDDAELDDLPGKVTPGLKVEIDESFARLLDKIGDQK